MARPSRLSRYRSMRDFRATREPAGAASRERGAVARRPVFVIQKHAATRLHWDFRLEADGALKSWAVTNEPRMDPAVRRLAIEVEDHPLDYAGFSGAIPRGQYGGGHVEIWDRGTYEPEIPGRTLSSAIEAGHVRVRLEGQRLQGSFALIRMRSRKASGKAEWLFFKVREKGEVAGKTRTREPAKSSRPAKPSVLTAVILRKGQPPRELEYSHVDKLMFPELGLTKGDVLCYYEEVADLLLPYLKDRPLTLERLPEGVGNTQFWQKNTPAFYPAWVPRIELPSETGRSGRKTVSYALAQDRKSLLYLVNQGALTFHIWPSRVGSLDCPDFVLFDLDPGAAPFDSVIEVARGLHGLLERQGIPNFVKTSGRAGLHVLVSWGARGERGGYDEARDWALAIAKRLVATLPGLATVERSKTRRRGRVYLDVMQNARGHHFVPPYVLRAEPEATVSLPLEWDEVRPGLDPKAFDVREVLRGLSRFARGRTTYRDPMKRLLSLTAGEGRRRQAA